MRMPVSGIALVVMLCGSAYADEQEGSLYDALRSSLARTVLERPFLGVGAQFGVYQASMDFWNDELKAEGASETFGFGPLSGIGMQARLSERFSIRLDVGYWTRTVSAEVTAMEAGARSVSGTDKIGLKLIPVTLAGVVYPLGTRGWMIAPYAGLGGGFCGVKLDRTRTAVDGRAIHDHDTGGDALGFLLFGLEGQLRSQVSLSVEARYVFGSYVQQKLVAGAAEDRDVSLSGRQVEARIYWRVW